MKWSDCTENQELYLNSQYLIRDSIQGRTHWIEILLDLIGALDRGRTNVGAIWGRLPQVKIQMSTKLNGVLEHAPYV